MQIMMKQRLLTLEEVALVADIDNMDSEADSLTLMTLHSAKGLSFQLSI